MDKPKQEKLVKVKRRLADKYDHLSKIAGSRPKRKTLANKAEKYRRQAAELTKD